MAKAKKKKRFLNVEIPILSKNTNAYAYELEELEGRYIKYDLTRILRGKGVELQLKIKIKGEKAVAEPVGMKIMPYYTKRITRKGTNYIEDSFLTNCKDAQIRIKPFLVTRRKVSRAVRKALRNRTREELINYSKDKKVSQLVEEIIKNKLQKQLSLILKKIYPLSTCEIRILKVEKEIEIKEDKKKAEEAEKTGKEIKKETAKKELRKEEETAE
jgi:ribosomal protein S3AE